MWPTNTERTTDAMIMFVGHYIPPCMTKISIDEILDKLIELSVVI